MATEGILLHLLVIRCQAGDEEAFASLLEQFGPRTLRYLERLVGDEAPDVHQEVWLRVYRNIGQLASPAAFVTWLLAITRHRAVDYLRQRRRASELFDDDPIESVLESTANAHALEAEADDKTDVDLPLVMAALPPLHREILLLRFQEDLSYSEIALVVGCSVGTVKSRLHHAKQRLHQLILRA